MPENTQMNQKMLLNAIQMYDFCLYDLQLYLDTHPTCTNALNAYRKYRDLHDNAVASYNRYYGPLSARQSDCDNQFSWAAGPWPWERGVN